MFHALGSWGVRVLDGKNSRPALEFEHWEGVAAAYFLRPRANSRHLPYTYANIYIYNYIYICIYVSMYPCIYLCM